MSSVLSQTFLLKTFTELQHIAHFNTHRKTVIKIYIYIYTNKWFLVKLQKYTVFCHLVF